MIDWDEISTEAIVVLAIIAEGYGWSISEMLRHLDMLTPGERLTVDDILDSRIYA